MSQINYYTSTSMFKSFNVVRKNGIAVQVVFHYNSAYRKGECITADKEIQELIEKRKEYAKGEIILYKTIKTADKEETWAETKTTDNAIVTETVTVETLKEVDEVTNYNEAKDYLRSIGVHHTKLKTPEKINEQAVEAGVTFPNLIK